MVRSRNESGLTVTDWCKENGINLKTYYYRLKRVRQAVCNEIEQHDIVPVEPIAGTETTAEKIELSVGDVKISLPDDFNESTLRRLLGVKPFYTSLACSLDSSFECSFHYLQRHGLFCRENKYRMI